MGVTTQFLKTAARSAGRRRLVPTCFTGGRCRRAGRSPWAPSRSPSRPSRRTDAWAICAPPPADLSESSASTGSAPPVWSDHRCGSEIFKASGAVWPSEPDGHIARPRRLARGQTAQPAGVASRRAEATGSAASSATMFLPAPCRLAGGGWSPPRTGRPTGSGSQVVHNTGRIRPLHDLTLTRVGWVQGPRPVAGPSRPAEVRSKAVLGVY